MNADRLPHMPVASGAQHDSGLARPVIGTRTESAATRLRRESANRTKRLVIVWGMIISGGGIVLLIFYSISPQGQETRAASRRGRGPGVEAGGGEQRPPNDVKADGYYFLKEREGREPLLVVVLSATGRHLTPTEGEFSRLRAQRREQQGGERVIRPDQVRQIDATRYSLILPDGHAASARFLVFRTLIGPTKVTMTSIDEPFDATEEVKVGLGFEVASDHVQSPLRLSIDRKESVLVPPRVVEAANDPTQSPKIEIPKIEIPKIEIPKIHVPKI